MAQSAGVSVPTVVEQMAASGVGALITSVVMTPLDVVKVRMQAQQQPLRTARCHLYCNGLMDHICSSTCPGYTQRQWFSRQAAAPIAGTVDGLVKIWRAEGAAALWAGLPPTLAVALPNTVLYFTAYEQIRRRLQKRGDHWWCGGVAGGAARLVSVTVCSPVELCRTKLQAASMSYRELGRVLRREVAVGGVGSLWRGWAATALRDVPFSVLYWGSYEAFKGALGQRERPSVGVSCVGGALCGGLAGAITLPLDVVKTHRQIDIGQRHLPTYDGSTRPRLPPSTLAHLTLIHRSSGIAGLFAGLTPRLCRVMPACALMISTYEYVKARIAAGS